MKIKEIRAYKVNLDLTRPYTIAYKTISQVENVIVELELENGIMGMGASNPSKYVVDESVKEVANKLTSENLEWLRGRDIRQYQQHCYELGQQFQEAPGTWAALDIALHDAFAQYLGLPLYKFLGKKTKVLPTSITIGIMNVEDTLKEARDYVDQKFKILKVKLGNSLEEDIERIAKLRETFGTNIVLRIDANQGYTFEQLVDFYHKTQKYTLELIEQPLPVEATESLRNLEEEIKQQIALDESLISDLEAYRLTLQPKACGIFNIKLMKSGGIQRAQHIADIGNSAGMELMWGCNDESIVSITAALHVAYANPHTKYIDLDGSLDLANDVVSGGFAIKEGIMYPLDLPGLGIQKL
ncbi:dipeptide epimerase [Rapidithrix thailandica]|uniref:Dipeptide epimerase n=1 Tax=Rapidithrix thailandica TaxID=413964 RepID=A0AAW9S213_9BACT